MEAQGRHLCGHGARTHTTLDKRHAPYDAHDRGGTSLSRSDPAYNKYLPPLLREPRRFCRRPLPALWFKLTHHSQRYGPPLRPRSRYLGPEVPEECLFGRTPVPEVDHPPPPFLIGDARTIADLKKAILATGLTVSQLVSTGLGFRFYLPRVRHAWGEPMVPAFASRRSATGKSITRRNCPKVLDALEGVQKQVLMTGVATERKSLLADLIVSVGGCVGIEEAARRAGHEITVPFTARPHRLPHREQTVTSNPSPSLGARGRRLPQLRQAPLHRIGGRRDAPSTAAQLLTAHRSGNDRLSSGGTAGPRGQSQRAPPHGRLHRTVCRDPQQRLLRQPPRLQTSQWGKSDIRSEHRLFEGRDRKTGRSQVDSATRVDLIFGSNSELRALAEVYASADGQARFLSRLCVAARGT